MERLEQLKAYAQRVLEEASCKENPSPLLADQINVSEHSPKKEEDGHVVSDAAHQQNFLRFLCGLSALHAGPAYRDRACALMQYMMDHPMGGGLMKWGGHRYLDLITLTDRGEKELVHELKNDYPYYELMFETDAEKAELYVKAFWNAHIYDFDQFEMGRHSMEKPYGVEGIWERKFGDPEPFAQRKGLSFRNTGNDLMYAAGRLREAKGDEGALLWAGHLHDMYMKCRHPKTGLGVYQFSQAMKRMETDDDTITLSFYGDRAKRQLGPEFGEIALEANVLLKSQELSIYALNPQVIAACYSHGSEKEQQMVAQTAENMKAFYRYGYDSKTRGMRPLLADGTDLTGYVLKRPGYYGPKGRVLEQHPLAGDYLLAYTQMALVSEDQELWQIVRTWALDLGLGDFGEVAGKPGQLNVETDSCDTGALLAVLKLCGLNPEYLCLAERLGENIQNASWHDGYYMKKDSGICCIDAIEPLALLKLEAVRQGSPELVADPIYNRSSSIAQWSVNRTIK